VFKRCSNPSVAVWLTYNPCELDWLAGMEKQMPELGRDHEKGYAFFCTEKRGYNLPQYSHKYSV
jgi:hypothetical protein